MGAVIHYWTNSMLKYTKELGIFGHSCHVVPVVINGAGTTAGHTLHYSIHSPIGLEFWTWSCMAW